MSRWRAVLMEARRMFVLLLPITGLNPLMFPGRLIGRLSCTQNRRVRPEKRHINRTPGLASWRKMIQPVEVCW